MSRGIARLRFVDDGAGLVPRDFYTPGPDTPKGACGLCGGFGKIPDRIDSDRHEVMVACYMCRMYCKGCKAWVKKAGHECGGAK